MFTPPPPTIAELVARALTATPFLAEATGATAHDLRISAELCAELAAEHWECERGTIVGVAVPWELTGEAADALEAHGRSLRAANDNTELYAAHAKLERSLAHLATARSSIKGTLPRTAAEEMMEEVEDHFSHIRIALTRALGILRKEINLTERAALREAV